MTLLHDAIENKKFDNRIIERNLTRNVISQADADKVSQKLPDDAENAEWVSTITLADEENTDK